MSYRDRLEERRWRLMNSYGWGIYSDGEVSSRIAEIDAILATLDANK